MQAIETSYNGYRFRSRLEARWATFFDAMGIEYLYEPEGYALDGTPYLPDFYLPQVKMWAEVKPDVFTQEERRKAKLLAKASRHDVLMLSALPDFTNYDAIEYDPWADDFFQMDYTLILLDGSRFPGGNYIPAGNPELYPSQYAAAVRAAKAARFEYQDKSPCLTFARSSRLPTY